MTKPMAVIISCGKAKRQTASHAKNLYIGGFFKMKLRWAKSLVPDDKIFILSAKHGLIKLDRPLEPYDLTMGQPGSVAPEVVKQQAQALGIFEGHKLLALTGAEYYRVLDEAGLLYSAPIRRMGMLKANKFLFDTIGKIPSEIK